MSAPATLRAATVQRKATSSASRGGLLQRKCSCGSAKSPLGQSCDECQSKSLQRKLVVGVSDDPFELEADRIADQVLSANPDRGGAAPNISRIGSQPAGSPTVAPRSVERTLAGSGTPLPPAVLHDMEQRFGCDFSRVRVHVGTGAEQSARDVSANAYTVGHDIVFGAGQFAPTTPQGRRLLAHELAHVVQQTDTARLRAPADFTIPSARERPLAAGRARGSRVQRDDTAPIVPFRTVPKYEIRWMYQYLRNDPDRWRAFDLQLRIGIQTQERRDQLVSVQIAEGAVGTLEVMADLKFTGNGRDILKNAIAEKLDDLPYSLDYIIPVGDLGIAGTMWKALFEPDSFAQHIDYLLSFDKLPQYAMFAGADLAIGAPPGKYEEPKKPEPDKPPPSIAKQLRALEALLKKVRAQEHRPRDLPDRLVHYPHKGGWWLNVRVHFDAQGKTKTHKAIALKQGEPVEKLYERTLGAVQDALEVSRAEERKRQEAEMPQWAVDLKAKVQRALGDEKGEDIPDGMTLVLEGRGARTRGPGQENIAQKESADTIETQVLLRIWVFRGSKQEPSSREQGSVPIFPKTDATELVRYVRNLAAVLRQGEHIPDDAEFHASEQLGEHMLPNFEAMILPLDLGEENITVASATNKFSLFLDFDKQYNAIGANALYVASKLYSQTIYYDWKIYEAPTGPGFGESTDEWKPRWAKLYDHYNPGSRVLDGEIEPTTRAGSVAQPASGFDTGDNDITTRVDFPDAPGDYLVYCETRHKPIGDAGLKRVSSVAYFPVRTRTREALTKPQVTEVSSGLEAINRNLADLRERLADEEFHPGTLKPTEKAVLQELLKSAEAQKEMFLAREHGDFVASADAQIKEDQARLRVVRRLKERLPKVLEQAQAQADAKANAKTAAEPAKPSELLADEPDLLTMYLYLRMTNKHAAAYEQELTREIKQLHAERERAIGFQNKFKDKSAGGCLYSPEAVFLSKIDGKLYPLKLAVGEAPTRSPERVAYTVVDVTLAETSKSYRGSSMEYGDEGHREAIDRAFKKFGDEGMYGTGWIVVRMPVGGPVNECASRRRPEIVFYDSEKGFLDKVIKILGLLAAFIGIVALTLTGVGATAAGALLGVLAATMGAVAAAHNISDRDDRNTLKFDAELVGDILAIVGLGEAIAAARLATLPTAMRGFQAYQRMGKFLALFQLGTGTASVLLIPIQTLEDINRIKALSLPPDVEREMINQAYGNAALNLVVAGTMIAHSRIQARRQRTGLPVEEDYAAARQQAELVALEDPEPPKSLRDRGWVDADGNWTDVAPEPIRQRAKEMARAAGAEAAPADAPPTEKIPDAAQKAVDRVNRGEVPVKGKTPGKRHADLGDTHEIREKQEPNGGISCEYHSPEPIKVPCPGSMGAPAGPRADTEKPAPRRTTDADEAPAARRQDEADVPVADEPHRKPGEVSAPARQPAESADADAAAMRDAATTEFGQLQKKVAANDRAMKTLQKPLADAQAKREQASSEYTATPHGNDTSDAGRANKRKRAKAGRKLREAEDEQKKVESLVNALRDENEGHYQRIKEIDRYLNPPPQTTGEKGSFAERQADSAIRAGKTEPVAGQRETLEGNFQFRGSSQDPHDPKKAKQQGLDGAYENTGERGPPHLAAEMKHDDAALRPGQETLDWVNSRLDDAVGYNQAERMRREGYEYWVFRYRPGTKTVEGKFLWEWRAKGTRNSRNQWEGTQHFHRRP